MSDQILHYMIIILLLLNFIWLYEISLRRMIKKQRHWKKDIWIVYFWLTPVVFILALKQIAFLNIIAAMFGLIGIWFSTSQISFSLRHYGIPAMAMPVSVIYLVSSTVLCFVSLSTL